LETGANIYSTARGRGSTCTDQRPPLEYTPGTNMIYSDWDMILVQLVMEDHRQDAGHTRRRDLRPWV
jgi:hypothetical protein